MPGKSGRRRIGVTAGRAAREGGQRGAKTVSGGKAVRDLPTDLLTLKIEIGETVLEKNLREVLYFGEKDLDNLTYEEIDMALFGASEFRISVGIAMANTQWLLEMEELELTRFEYEESDKAKNRIHAYKKKLRNGKVTEETLRASRDERITEMLKDPEAREEWRDRKIEVSKLRKNYQVLKHLNNALEERIIVLQGISKRKFSEVH